MELRDDLAVKRTVLANQRTLLAFINTAMALLISGISLIKLFQADFTYKLGWTLSLLSLVLLVLGLLNYVKHQKTISVIYKNGNHSNQFAGEADD